MTGSRASSTGLAADAKHRERNVTLRLRYLIGRVYSPLDAGGIVVEEEKMRRKSASRQDQGGVRQCTPDG